MEPSTDMQFAIITLFPDMFRALADFGVIGRAIATKKIMLSFFNPRDFAKNRQRRVDDRPYGGGPGMVMMAEPLYLAIQAAKNTLGENTPVYFLSPQGKRLEQSKVASLAKETAMILICGRYEGVDQRLIEAAVDEEISIGDYIVSGGELPAMILADAIGRLLPGVLGDPRSCEEESFQDENTLDYPVYTSPRLWRGHEVSEVLLSGDHEKIADFRKKAKLRIKDAP